MKKMWFSNLALLLGCVSASSAYGQYPGAYGSLGPSAFPVQYQQPMGQPSYQPFGQSSAPVQMTGVPMTTSPVSGPALPGNGGPLTGVPTTNATMLSNTNQTYMVPNGGMQGVSQPGWLGQRNAAFQLVGTQENVHAVPAYGAPTNNLPSNAVPAPVPMSAPMQGGPQSIMESGAPMQHSMNAPMQTQGQALSYQSAPGVQSAPMMNPVYGQAIAPGCTSCGSAPLAESYGYPVYDQSCQSCGPQAYAPQFGSRFSNFARGSVFTGMPVGSKPYFGGGSVLLFHRVDDDNVNLTYNVNTGADVLGTRDARFGLMPGFEVFLGRYFNCGRNAFTASYWGLFPEDEMATVTNAGGADLRSRYMFTGVTMPAFGTYGQAPVYDWYDSDPANNTTSIAQRIDRSSEYHNIEGNLLGFMTGGAARSFYLPTSGTLFSGTRGLQGGFGGGYGGCGYCGGAGCGACGGGSSCGMGSCGTSACGPASCGSCNACPPTRFATGPCCLTPGCGSRLNMTWLAGVRYFRFRDNLSYMSSLTDTNFGNGNDDIYYDSRVVNDLVGAQIGGILNFCTGRRASLYALTKMGIYGNHARFNSEIGTRNGHAAYVSAVNSPNFGQDYVISSSKTDVAFLGELGSGVNYRLTSKWSANVGYRAIVVSGVATAVDQLPINMSHLGNASNFDNNAALILHGVSLGAQYNY